MHPIQAIKDTFRHSRFGNRRSTKHFKIPYLTLEDYKKTDEYPTGDSLKRAGLTYWSGAVETDVQGKDPNFETSEARENLRLLLEALGSAGVSYKPYPEHWQDEEGETCAALTMIRVKPEYARQLRAIFVQLFPNPQDSAST